MPTVEIKRSTSSIPSSTGFNNAPSLTPDPYAGTGLEAVGEGTMKLAQQYKMAEDATYVANSSIDVQQKVADLQKQKQKEFVNNPAGFAKSLFQDASPIYQDAITNAPSGDARRALQSQLAGFARSDFMEANAWEQRATVSNYLTKHQDSVNLLSNRLFEDPSQAAQIQQQHNALILSAQTFLSPEELNKLKDSDGKQLAQAAIYGTMDKNPAAAEKLIDSGHFDSEFTAVERERLLEQIDRKQTHLDTQLKAEQNKQREAQVNTALLDIYQAKSLDDVNHIQQRLDGLLKDKTLGAKEYLTLTDRLDRSYDKISTDESSKARVSAAYDNGTPLSPHSKDDQKAVDNYYNDVFSATIDQSNPQQTMSKTVAFVTKVGVIPKTLKTDIESGLAGGTPDRQLKAADYLMQFVNQSPQLAREFNSNDMAFARKVTDSRNAGMTAEDAVKSAQVQVYEKDTAPYKERLGEFKKEYKAFDYSNITEWLRRDPANVPPEMKADWDTLYRNFYMNNQMSEPQARDLAYKKLETQWGISKLSGEPRWVRNAPETVYGVQGVDNGWMKNDLNKTVERSYVKPAQVTNFGADTVQPFTSDRIQKIQALVEKPSAYDDIFKEAAKKYNLDWQELKLRSAVESGLTSKAVGPQTPYGQSVGLMQLTEETAKGLGVTDRTDPRQSIFGAAQLLSQQVKSAGGDMSKVDKLYYGGPDQSKWGKNTLQYAENLQAVRNFSGSVTKAATTGEHRAISDKAFVIQNPSTYASQKPNYFVMYTDENGVIRNVPSSDNPGMPLKWQPDWNSSPEFQTILQKQQERMNELEASAPKARIDALEAYKNSKIRNSNRGIQH